MYCVMRASAPSLYNVYRRYDTKMLFIKKTYCLSIVITMEATYVSGELWHLKWTNTWFVYRVLETC